MRFKQRFEYEHPGLGEDRQRKDEYAALKMATCKWVSTILEQHYPGHAWHVQVRVERDKGNLRATNGSIMIRLNGLMPPDAWYHIKLADTQNEGGRAHVIKGAGELLERYNIPRTGFMLDHWRAALNSMPIAARLAGKGHKAPLFS
jgi:hypothetical protein